MNSSLRYILIGLGIILAILCIWYFINIVAYILVSVVLALVGKPIVDLLGKIHIGKIKLPKPLRAFLTLMLIWLLCFAFFRIFIPLIANEIDSLSSINPEKLLASLEEPIEKLESVIDKYQIAGEGKFVLEDFIANKATSFLNVSFLKNFLSSIAGIMGNIFIAFFAISFMTFFFLRDERLFAEGILAMVPDKHVEAFKHAMNSTRYLLRRYFVGILGQITGIFTLVTTGLTIVGVGFNHSILIGLIAGLLNVIPYIGPLIGSALGVLIGIATHLDLEFYAELLPLIGFMILIFIIVQTIDNVLFQPLIFSSSVNAHPLEIFIVILVAGSLAGITGMILAIPTYTVVRVFAKEFFNNFKVVKKLTKNIH
ncbi:MAG: AI-2E family transporter [Bacteroidales bacterium]|nr:AI-2E family transporter [Bacteroidales bacterium]